MQHNLEDKSSQEEKFPSHTELYKGIHLIEDDIMKFIYDRFNWDYAPAPEYSLELERKGWDIVIHIIDTSEKAFITPTDKTLFDKLPSESKRCLLIEYKSNIEEWGKQIDDFFRQVKKRSYAGLDPVTKPILLTFDERFTEYQHAFIRAGINLIILPKLYLNIMRDENRKT